MSYFVRHLKRTFHTGYNRVEFAAAPSVPAHNDQEYLYGQELQGQLQNDQECPYGQDLCYWSGWHGSSVLPGAALSADVACQ
jgi:hypothetical protein